MRQERCTDETKAFMAALASEVDERRREKGTLREISEQTGISMAQICQISKGSCSPSLESLVALTRCFGISMEALMSAVEQRMSLASDVHIPADEKDTSPDTSSRILGRRIRKCRKEQRITLETLSKSVGICMTVLSRIERGKSPRVDELSRIATALRTTVIALLSPAPDNDIPPETGVYGI